MTYANFTSHRTRHTDDVKKSASPVSDAEQRQTNGYGSPVTLGDVTMTQNVTGCL